MDTIIKVKGGFMNENLKSPLKTIRAHCIDCSGTADEVKKCTVKQCKLWPYRFGKAVNRPKKILTEEQKEKFRSQVKNPLSEKHTDIQ